MKRKASDSPKEKESNTITKKSITPSNKKTLGKLKKNVENKKTQQTSYSRKEYVYNCFDELINKELNRINIYGAI